MKQYRQTDLKNLRHRPATDFVQSMKAFLSCLPDKQYIYTSDETIADFRENSFHKQRTGLFKAVLASAAVLLFTVGMTLLLRSHIFGPKEIIVQTQPRNVQAEKIAEIVDFEKKINEKKRQYQELEKTTIRTIERMNDPVCENILIFRYCYRRSWKYIADKLHYRESYIFALHSKALEKVYPLIDWAAE